MENVLVPTEFTFLSKCALELGIELAAVASAEIHVVSIIEPFYNAFMEPSDKYSEDPTSSIANIHQTEAARKRMQERVMEIREWAPQLKVTPKISFGHKLEVLLAETVSHQADVVIVGGDQYQSSDKVMDNFLHQSDSPVLTLKCKINDLSHYRDIIFLADMDQDGSVLIKNLKKLQGLLDATIHVLRVNTPNHFLSFAKCTESLENYVKRHDLTHFELVSLDAQSEMEGLLAYCENIQHAFVAMAVHDRSFLDKLMGNIPEGEILANSVHPVWTYKN